MYIFKLDSGRSHTTPHAIPPPLPPVLSPLHSAQGTKGAHCQRQCVLGRACPVVALYSRSCSSRGGGMPFFLVFHPLLVQSLSFSLSFVYFSCFFAFCVALLFPRGFPWRSHFLSLPRRHLDAGVTAASRSVPYRSRGTCPHAPGAVRDTPPSTPCRGRKESASTRRAFAARARFVSPPRLRRRPLLFFLAPYSAESRHCPLSECCLRFVSVSPSFDFIYFSVPCASSSLSR